jgi:hypothetical protein
MSKFRNAWTKVKGWLGSNDPPSGGGPGGGPTSQSYNRAQVETEMLRARNAGDSGFS